MEPKGDGALPGVVARLATEPDVAAASLPTRFGRFDVLVFRMVDPAEPEVVALVRGTPWLDGAALVRLHSECLTGDVMGSVRCECGEQLELSLQTLARAGSGVLLYLRQEGRGIGLFNKIKAYELQDQGLDTVDANVRLGLPIDGRDYAPAAGVLRRLGVRRVRLLTNNPDKCRALAEAGIDVVGRVPLEVPPRPENRGYLRTKAVRMGHLLHVLQNGVEPAPARPSVTLHYAQTLDGRIAARVANADGLASDESLALAHQLRADHDAVLVGVGTVLADDPRLTVRVVEGRSPLRIVLDSSLRLPLGANVLNDGQAPTVVATTDQAPAARVEAVRRQGVSVVEVPGDGDGRVDFAALLVELHGRGIGSVLVEGGAAVITSLLRARMVDRVVVRIAPRLAGGGIAAVGDLDILRLDDALSFERTSFQQIGSDIVFDGTIRSHDAA